MVIENDPSARYQVRSLGELMAPASCLACGSGNCDDGYVDLAVFIDFIGTAYICMACATEMGSLIGMFTADEVKQTQDLANKLAEDNDYLKSELARVQPILSAFDSAIDLLGSTGDSVSARDLEVVQEESGSDSEPVEGSADGEPEAKEPAKSSGRSNSGGSKSRNLAFG